MIIYLAKNTVNGKCYVGCTSLTLKKRQQQHCGWKRKENPSAIQNAIRKYGTIAFEWEVLEICLDKEVMFQREMFWIKELNTFSPNGYNMTFGGEGGKVSPEAIEKIRLKKIGKKASEETKHKMSISHSGKKMPEGFSETMRNVVTGFKHSEQTKKKIGYLQRGKPGTRLGRQNLIPQICFERIGEEL